MSGTVNGPLAKAVRRPQGKGEKRDKFVLDFLRAHPEQLPPLNVFEEQLPGAKIEALRQALITDGWVENPEYDKAHPELKRSKLPAHCLRTSLWRLYRRDQLPSRPKGRPSTGKKVVKPKLAAKTVYDVGIAGGKLKLSPAHPADIDRRALVIEAARTGLKVRILVDGVIEVQP